MKITNEHWYLVAGKLANEASADELRQLDVFLQNHPEEAAAIDQLTRFWQQKTVVPAERKEEIDLMWVKFKARL